MFKHQNLKEKVKVMEITKKSYGEIIVPALGKNSEFNFPIGLYEWEFNSKILKCGLFGEGVSSTASKRYASYRNVGKYLWDFLQNPKKNTNGSYKPMKILNEILKEGESISVYFYEVTDPIVNVGGTRYKIDLASIEKEMKEYNRDTIILN